MLITPFQYNDIALVYWHLSVSVKICTNDRLLGVQLQAWLSLDVKGCQMPALNLRANKQPLPWAGRRRTSLKGGNRGIYQGWSEQLTDYGDLSGWPVFDMLSKSV